MTAQPTTAAATVAAREQRWRRGRGTRSVGVLVSLAVIVATVLALATNDPLGASGAGLDAREVVAPSPLPVDGDPVPPGGTGLLDASGSVAGPDGSPVPPFASTGEADRVDLAAGAPAAPTPTEPTTVVGPDGTPVIVHPVLQFLAFGGQLGMPLVCTVVASVVGQVVSDPAVVAVLGEIQSACVAGATQGADALRQLDEQLAALAAINPAVGPLLDGLAAVLEAASQTDAPFASYLLQIVALVRFFQGR